MFPFLIRCLIRSVSRFDYSVARNARKLGLPARDELLEALGLVKTQYSLGKTVRLFVTIFLPSLKLLEKTKEEREGSETQSPTGNGRQRKSTWKETGHEADHYWMKLYSHPGDGAVQKIRHWADLWLEPYRLCILQAHA